MAKYRLRYSEPYEFDDDSPSGEGDHDVRWADSKTVFEAESDEAAERITDKFINENIEVLGETLHRKKIELIKII